MQLILRVLLVVFCFSASSLCGQESKLDSLLKLAEAEKQDTTRVNLYNDLVAECIKNGELNRGMRFAEMAVEIARKSKYKKGEAYALKNQGLVQYYKGEYLDVLDYWTRSLAIFEEIDFPLGIANLSSNLGVVYYDQGSMDRALDFIHLYPNGFSFTTTITMAMICSELNVDFYSIDYYKRQGKSKIQTWKDTVGFFNLLLKIALYFNPFKFFRPIIWLFLLISIYFLIRDVFYLKDLTQGSIFFPIITLIFFTLGLMSDLIIKRR